MKGKSKSARKFVRILIAVLAVTALSVGAWKSSYLLNFSDTKIEMFQAPSEKTKNIYDMYKVTVEKAAKNVYYVRLEDVICDAAPDYDGTRHYFRVNVTFETGTEETAELLKNNEKDIIATLRDTMKDLRVRERNGERIMGYIKDHAMRKAERITGKGGIKGVYFELFLSQ